MLREFRKVSKNEYPIREISLENPDEIFRFSILSISKVVGTTMTVTLNEMKKVSNNYLDSFRTVFC